MRQKIGDPLSISTQNMFPLLPATPKLPELPYGAKYFFVAENQVFQFFPLLIPKKGPLLVPYMPLLDFNHERKLCPELRIGAFLRELCNSGAIDVLVRQYEETPPEKLATPKKLAIFVFVAPYCDSGGFGTTEMSGNIFCVEIDPGSPNFSLPE